MIHAILAVLTAFSWGLGEVFARKGLEESNFFSATFIITIIGNVIFSGLALSFVPLGAINPEGALLFILAGLISPGLARLFYLKGMEKLGASSTAAIFAINPMIASIIAILLLNERPTFGIYVGTICVICGAAILSKATYSNARLEKRTRIGLIFPFLAAASSALGYTFRKIGLNIYNEPIMGVALGYLAALFLYTLTLTLMPGMRSIVSVSTRNLRLFWKTGVSFSVGWILAFYALMYENVTTVIPLVNMEPLFVFLFSYFYLKELEKLSSKLVIGILVVVVGVILIMRF